MLPLLLLLLETSAATAQTSPGATCAAVSIPDFSAEVPIASVAVGFDADIGDNFQAVRDFLIDGVSIGGSVTVPEGTIVGDISLVNVNIPAVQADLDARGVANFLDLTARLRLQAGNIGVESIVGFGNDVSLQVRCNDRVGLVKKFEAEGFVVTDVDNNLADDRMVSLTIVGAALGADDQVLEIIRVFNSLRVATGQLQIDSVALVQLFSCSDACGTRGRCVIRDVMDVSSITEALTMPVQCVCEHGFFGENCEQNEYSLAGATHVVHPPACAPFMIEKCEEYEACCLEECGKLQASTIEFRCQKYKHFVKYSLKCACIVNGPGQPSPDFCDHKCGDGQPGSVGAIGFQGDNGDNGDDGGSGPDGAQGEDGHPGDVGDPGPHGDPGPDGPNGVDGGPGNPGTKGPIGAEGETGPKGGFGEEGLKGYKGDPGIWGLPGACGHNGDKGQPGNDGEKGFEGNTGPTGGQGATGDQGEPGDEGNAGIPGDRGRQGHRGPRGQDGEAGEPGGPGNPGPQGDKGYAGSYGSTGHAGEVGDKGDKGQPGGPGGRGDPGTTGGDGAPGPKGPQGPKGEKGTSEYSQDIIFHG